MSPKEEVTKSGEEGNRSAGHSSPPRGEWSRIDVAVAEEQTAGLFGRAHIAFLTVLVNALLLVWVLQDAVPLPYLLGWLTAVGVILGLRESLVVAYFRHRGGARPWSQYWTVGALANGVTWGAAGLLFFTDQVALQVFLSFAIGGMVAGAASSAQSSTAAYLVFSIPALLPITLRLLTSGVHISGVMGGMLLIYGGAMTALALRSARSFVTAARYRLRNQELSQELQRRSSDAMARFRALLDQAATAILVADLETLEVIDLSDRAIHLVGRDRWQDPGRELSLHELQLIEPLDEEAWRVLIAEAQARGHAQLEGRSGGRTLEVSVSVQRVRDRDYLLVVARDVSERRVLEKELARANHLASVGTLAAGVAHEINNPLAYISGNLELLEEELDGEHLALVEESLAGAFRISEIIKDLNYLARPNQEELIAPIPVREVLETSLKFARRRIAQRARLVLEVDEVPPVYGHRLRLSQVLINLLVNAAQAIPEGQRDKHRVTVQVKTMPSGDVRVAISDTGQGIALDMQQRIFDPFFTTKPVGVGTGLGLSICHRIVTSFGGTLSVDSEPGEGATFTVDLKAAEGEAVLPAAVSPSRAPRALVIDSDVGVAREIKRALETYLVINAADSRDGMDLLLRHDFDIVFCDPETPELDPPRLMAAAQSRGARVILLGPSGALRKPLQAGDLVAAVSD